MTRGRLATEQADFLRSLTGGPPVPGFDPGDLAAVADVLARKRREAVAHAAPDIAALPAFAGFLAWARRHPNRGRDGADFLRTVDPADRTSYACLAAARSDLAHRLWHLHLWRSREAPVLAARLGPLRLLRH